MSSSKYVSAFLNNQQGLGDLHSDQIDFRAWVESLKAQESGENPDVHKINGNMAYYAREKADTHPKNKYLNSLMRDGQTVLNDLKKRVPGAFGIDAEPANMGPHHDTTDGSSGNGNTSGSNGNPPATTGEDSFSIAGKQVSKKSVYIGGGALALTAVAVGVILT